MTHLVDVSQLRSTTDKGAFLNVDAEYGRIAVWTSTYSNLTFLLRSTTGMTVWLIQFDDAGWAYEWLLANAHWFNEIEVL